MSVYVSPQSSYSRGRGIRASEVAREMLESPNMGRCIEDLLPRMHIIEDRNDANDILHRSQPMVAEYFCPNLLMLPTPLAASKLSMRAGKMVTKLT